MEKTTILRLMVDYINIEFGSMEHLDFAPMDEFDYIMSGEDHLEIIESALKGKFNPKDAYFSWNSNGNLISFSKYYGDAILLAYEDEIIEEYQKFKHDNNNYLAKLGVGVTE